MLILDCFPEHVTDFLIEIFYYIVCVGTHAHTSYEDSEAGVVHVLLKS